MKNLRIASPCPTDWNRMVGDDRVRHCAQCNLNVYNLAAMTMAEAEELITASEGRVCLRLYQRRDGTVLTKDCPIGFQIKVRRISRIAGAALAGAMTVVGAAAQTLPGKSSVATDNKSGKVKIEVLDASGGAVQNAQIQLWDISRHQPFSGKTLNDGVFQTNLPAGEYRLDITSPGFQDFRQVVSVSHGEAVIVHLQVDVTLVQGGPMFADVEPATLESSDLSLARIEPRPDTSPAPSLPHKK